MTSTDPTFRLTPETALALWRQALTCEVGLRVPCKIGDLDKIRAMMYKARQEAAEPALEVLMLAIKPGGEEFWLVKKTVEAP